MGSNLGNRGAQLIPDRSHDGPDNSEKDNGKKDCHGEAYEIRSPQEPAEAVAKVAVALGLDRLCAA